MNIITPNADPVFSFEGAYELGTIDSSLTIQETVGGNDEGDVYSFTVGEAGKYSFNLDGLSADADLALLDSEGEIIDFPQIDGNQGETIAVDLAEGNYFVVVLTFDGQETNYTLDISADEVLATPGGNTIIPTVDPGGSLDTAFDLGSLEETVIIQETIAQTAEDNIDLYQFTVDEVGEYTFGLDGLSADANLFLINAADVDANGDVTAIATSESLGTEAESIVTELDTGTYYVAVLSADGAPTEYSLSAGNGTIAQDTGVEVITPPSDPGADINTAFDLGAIAGTVSVAESVGTVGIAQDTRDIYEFSVDEAGEYTLTLDGLSDNADLLLVSNEDADGDGLLDIVGSSETTGTEAEIIAGELDAGTYYVAVTPADNASTDYVLTVSDGTTTTVEEDPEEPPFEDPGDTLDTALVLGEYTGNVSTSLPGTIGGEDLIDVFQFSIAETHQFEAALSNLDADVDLGLFNASGELIISSETSGVVDESFSTTIEAGDYFVGVVSFDGVETNYDLDIAFSNSGASPFSANTESIGTAKEDYSLV